MVVSSAAQLQFDAERSNQHAIGKEASFGIEIIIQAKHWLTNFSEHTPDSGERSEDQIGTGKLVLTVTLRGGTL